MSALISRYGQVGMYVMFACFAIMFYMNGVVAVEMGLYWTLLPGMLLISPVMMALLRLACEGPLRISFINPRVMSWGFVVGDCAVLPFALWLAARGRQDVAMTAMEEMMSIASSGLIGLVVMIGFRKFDGNRYRQVGWESSLKSPTKVWHDCVVMPVVVALLAWLLVPQLLHDVSVDGILALVMLAVFGILIGVDTITSPDPRRQHCQWDPKRFEPIGPI